MITVSQIAGLRTSSDDFERTEQLKHKFARLRHMRRPFFLTAAEFDEILEWKLRGQYGRQRALREPNTDELIRAVTDFALTISHDDKDYELDLRVRALCILRGVSVAVASAVLALVFPDEYAVIDFRVWRQLFDEERRTFTVPDYKTYMKEIRRLAAELEWAAQEVDLAIWEYDRRQSGLVAVDTITPSTGRVTKQSKTVTGKRFYYARTEVGGVIVYPTDKEGRKPSGTTIRVSTDTVEFIRSEIGKPGVIAMGASFDNPPPGSLGCKLREEGNPPVLSYVIPLLTEEGFCEPFMQGRSCVIRHTGT